MKTKVQYLSGAILPVALAAGVFFWKGEAVSAEPPASQSSVAAEQAAKEEHRRGHRRMDDEGRHGRTKRDKMKRVGGFLDFMNRFYGSVQDPYQATGFAALSVREHFKRQGKPLEAVAPIEKMLASTKDQRMRNVLLFTLRQVYEEAKQEEQFIALNEQIMRENIAFAETQAGQAQGKETQE